MIKLLLVVTTMFVSGYDTRVSEVADIDKCVAEAPAILKGAEMIRGVRAAKVECVERAPEAGAAEGRDTVKITLASAAWVEPATQAKGTQGRFTDTPSGYGHGYGYGYGYGDYDTYGYDQWGYDHWGFDRWGYDRWGFDRWGYDRWGYPRYGAPRPGWANPWPSGDFCARYPGHPSCRHADAPQWSGSGSVPLPNPARPIPNPARPMNE